MFARKWLATALAVGVTLIASRPAGAAFIAFDSLVNLPATNSFRTRTANSGSACSIAFHAGTAGQRIRISRLRLRVRFVPAFDPSRSGHRLVRSCAVTTWNSTRWRKVSSWIGPV